MRQKMANTFSSAISNIFLPAPPWLTYTHAYFLISLGHNSRCSGGGATRPLSWDGDAEELRGDPTIGPRHKVWTGETQMQKYLKDNHVVVEFELYFIKWVSIKPEISTI